MIDNKPKSCFPNFFVILLLPLVLLIVAFLGYLGYIPLKIEIHSLLILGFIFFIFIFFIRHNANYVACKIKGSLYEMEESLKAYIKDHELEIDGKKKSLASIDNFFEESIKDLRNDNISSIASTIFPMLGILGTFIAIAISMPSFGVKSTEALDREISLLLSGVGTAFYASIYGIFLSLLWIFFEKRGVSKIDYILKYLKRLYQRKIWSKEEIERYRLVAIKDSNEAIVNSFKDALNVDMIKNLNQRYIEDFEIIVNKVSNNFSKITTDMNTSMANFENSLKEMYHSENALKATIKIDENLKDFTDTIGELKSVVERANLGLSKNIDKNFEKIDKEIADIVVKLADFGFLLDEQIEKVFLAIEQYHKELLKFSKKL